MTNALGPLAALVTPSLRGAAAYHVPTPTGIVAKLDANESPYEWPVDLRERIAARLADVQLHRYPDASALALRTRLAREFSPTMTPAQVVLGNGSDELIGLLLAAFAAPRPGARVARVLYPVPTFVYYKIAATARGIEAVEVPLADDFSLDEDAIRWAFTEMRPNVAFFALPNNPTGTLWPLAFIADLARSNPDVIIVADEAYLAYSGQTLAGALIALPNLVVMRTLSKVGLAGLRVGFLAASTAITTELEKVRPPYNVGAFNQAAALVALDEGATWMAARAAAVIAERGRVVEALAKHPTLRIFDTQSNLVMVRVAGDGRASQLWQHLVDRGVLVRTFDRPGAGALAGCLRITIGTPTENSLLLAAIEQWA